MDISVIIVSYNSGELLRNCLKSVAIALKDKKISGEVIIVDNGSSDASVEVARKFKVQNSKFKVEILENRENVGFGGANNLGAEQAKGRYLLFLNPDTQVKPGALAEMVKFMDENPAAGIAGCRLVNPDGSFQPQGGYLPRLSTVAVWALFIDDIPVLGRWLPSYQSRSKLRSNLGSAKVRPFGRGWVGGTAMVVRRQAWEQLGGFDENIFMYGEDVEICYRANKLGWKVMINPDAEITHVGKTSGGNWVTGEVGGLLYIFKKHKPGWEMPILRVILALGMGLRWLIFGILGGNEELRKAYAGAVRISLH